MLCLVAIWTGGCAGSRPAPVAPNDPRFRSFIFEPFKSQLSSVQRKPLDNARSEQEEQSAADEPPARRVRGASHPNWIALIVGVEAYSQVARPIGARRDVEQFSEQVQSVLGVPPDRIRVLLDDQATRNRIEQGVSWLVDNASRHGTITFYSDKHADVANMTAGCPQGTAQVTAVNRQGQAELQFIFPHTDNDKPNASDKAPVVYPSGRKLYYRIAKQRGGATTASDVVEFQMPDKLTIANFGDSYASGERAPYSSGAKWDNLLCHRSGNSGSLSVFESAAGSLLNSAEVVHYARAVIEVRKEHDLVARRRRQPQRPPPLTPILL